MASSQVARCPVTLFEAIVAGPWRLCPAIGELNIQEAGGKDAGWLVFQLHDLLDGQVLFQTTRPSTAYFKLSERFHIIKQENGTYRGFGFSDADAAAEIFDFVALETSTNGKGSPSAYELQRSLMPAPRVARPLFPSGRQGCIDEMGGPESPPPVLSRFKSKSGPLRSSVVLSGTSPHFSSTSPSSTPSPGTSPASVLASSSASGRGRSISLPKEKSANLPIPATPQAAQGLPVLGTPRMSPPWSPNSDPYSEPPTVSCGFSPGKTKFAVKAKLQRILSGGRDRYDGPDMDIGYPYNIQHEGHIGWTPPPSASSESAWMDSPSSGSFVSPPLSSFGSPGSDELGGNWTAATPHAEFAPPAPPPEYVDKLPAKEPPSPSPVTPTKAKRTLSFSRRRNTTQPQTLHPL